MAKADVTLTLSARDVPQVVELLAAATVLAHAVRAYGMAKLRSEKIMREGDPLPGEWMGVVAAHDAFVVLAARSAPAEAGETR